MGRFGWGAKVDDEKVHVSFVSLILRWDTPLQSRK